MGFSAIARVTDEKWITCTARDEINFGLKPGDELELETTICNEVRLNQKEIAFNDIKKGSAYASHPSPALYGFQSYISVPIYKRDGSFFGTLCAIDPKPAKLDTSEVVGMFKLYADLLSFHLQAIDDMNTANARLEEEQRTSELREQFIAILGHDLKNPVASIRMGSEILLKLSENEIALRQAGMIKSASFRMETLIDNILDFARGRLGEGINLKLKKNNGTLQKTINQVIKEIRIISPNRIIQETINLEYPVTCDKDRIAQLLSNLLGNADAHGAEDLPIKVEVHSNDGKFTLAVSNGGNKIPESAMKQLFQPFYRAEVNKGKQGLGLGLYIASEIAKAHGGSLIVHSTDEVTRFAFEMPLETSSLPDK